MFHGDKYHIEITVVFVISANGQYFQIKYGDSLAERESKLNTIDFK